MLALALVFAALATSAIASPFAPSVEASSLFSRTLSSGCSTTGTASCHNTTAVSNLCCFEYPGGLLLQTQFWDTDPSTGPSNSWTIHGLWPDHCDQTYDESCDPSRDYTDIADLLTAQGASDTLAYMQTYWVDIDGENEQFWEHEWSTHGTCYSTLEPSCLPSGSATGAEAVAFFQTVVKLFKTLPTYTWLANAGITPSATATYTLASLNAALKSGSGVTPALTCTSGSLSAISWYFNLEGSVIDGTFLPIDAPASGSCASTGIKYPLKSGSPVTTATTATTATITTTATTKTTTTATTTQTSSGSLPTKAMIHAIQSSTLVGGLLTLGTWSTQTLATMTLAGTTSSFTMTSSKGACGVSSGVLTCGSGVSATTFSAVTSGGNLLLASGGSTAFSSTGVPSGTTVYAVYTGSSYAQDYTLSIVST